MGALTLINPVDLVARAPVVRHGNLWKYLPGLMVLQARPYANPSGRYEVDLEACTTCAQALNWIFHLDRKTWASKAPYVADLVESLQVYLPAELWFAGRDGGKIDVRRHLRKWHRDELREPSEACRVKRSARAWHDKCGQEG